MLKIMKVFLDHAKTRDWFLEFKRDELQTVGYERIKNRKEMTDRYLQGVTGIKIKMTEI